MSDYDVIVVGGGIVGASIAYHVGELGRYSACLLERGTLTCGTTWHAAGLVAELRASANLTRLAKYSGELYESLEARGHHTGYRRVGALTLALNDDRRIELERQAAMARSFGVDCTWLGREAIAERWPHLRRDDVVGGVYMPNDGQTNPVDTTRVLAEQARSAGVVVREQTRVEKLVVQHGRITGVQVDGQILTAARVVLACGLWTRALAAEAGACVPLYPCEHSYAVTEAVSLGQTPIVRVPDHAVYLKPDAGRVLVGCFELQAKPLDPDSLPADFSFDELPFDLDQFAPYLQAGLERLPALQDVGIRTFFNGPESFTPDGRYILGECPEVENLFVAAGFNSIGIQSAGGVGRVMAQWLDTGHAPIDLWDVDVRRFQPAQNNPEYLAARVTESLGLLYAMHWPYRQPATARDLLRSPLHELTRQQGACFGELAGWERPNWYAHDGADPVYEYSYGRQNWFDNSAAEHVAVRRDVALFDQTSFAKFRIAGPDACRFLNWTCTADLRVPVGKVVYCQCLNERGGIEADVTVTRVGECEYWYVTAAACRVRDEHWLRRVAEPFDVEIEDITLSFAVLGLMGPRARQVLTRLSGDALDHAAFGFATSQRIEVAGVAVRATRITYVGALGWELYVPWDDARTVFEALVDQDLTLAGYHAMDSLRLEKGYRHWGHDLSDEDTPLEAGLGFTVAWDKPDGFLGREALLAQKEAGVAKRLALFTLDDPEALLLHDEPVWADGKPAGRVTSAAYGHSVGRAVGLGYVHGSEPFTLKALRARSFEIEVAGKKIPARVSTRALYDPDNREINC